MKTVLNVKVDKEIKEKAQRMTSEMGIPLSIVVNSMLRDFIIAKEFTFKYEPSLKPEIAKELDDLVKNYKKSPKRMIATKSVKGLKTQLGL